MKTTLYVFSATGNSLTTAKTLAEKINAKLISVASTKNAEEIIDHSDSIGFVFPVYYGNMPYPVREMITKMKFSSHAYIFTVATYRGHAGDVAKRMDALLKTRGGKLSLSLGLPMPGNSFINKPEVDAEYLAMQRENIDKLIPALQAKEMGDYVDTKNFQYYYNSLSDAITSIDDCYEDSISLDDGQYYFDEEADKYVFLSYSSFRNKTEPKPLEESINDFDDEVQYSKESLSYIKTNKVNSLELLMDAEFVEQSSIDQDIPIAHQTSEDIDASLINESMLEDPEALIKLLKKKNKQGT